MNSLEFESILKNRPKNRHLEIHHKKCHRNELIYRGLEDTLPGLMLPLLLICPTAIHGPFSTREQVGRGDLRRTGVLVSANRSRRCRRRRHRLLISLSCFFFSIVVSPSVYVSAIFRRGAPPRAPTGSLIRNEQRSRFHSVSVSQNRSGLGEISGMKVPIGFAHLPQIDYRPCLKWFLESETSVQCPCHNHRFCCRLQRSSRFKWTRKKMSLRFVFVLNFEVEIFSLAYAFQF